MWQINLIPEELQQKYHSNVIVQSILLTVIVTLILVALIHFTLTFSIARMEGKPIGLKDMMIDSKLSQLKRNFNSFKTEKKNLYKTKGPLIEIISIRYAFGDILKSIANITTEKVWFDEMILNSKLDECNLNGKSFNTRLVSEFMLEMKRLPYFKDIRLTHMEKSEKSNNLFEFKIGCQFN